jgi:Tfp pilus assembly protein PilN
VIRFNYLDPARRSIFDRLADLEIRPATRYALAGLFLTVALCFAIGIYQMRELAQALRDEDVAKLHARVADNAMRSARRRAGELHQLYELDQVVRSMHASGPRHAALILDIGNRLPSTMRIAQIGNDGAGIVVTGESTDYRSVSEALLALQRAGFVTAPHLREVHATAGPRRDIAYTFMVAERAR